MLQRIALLVQRSEVSCLDGKLGPEIEWKFLKYHVCV